MTITYRIKNICMVILLVITGFLYSGCNDGGYDDYDHTDDRNIRSCSIEGTAYYPFYDEDNQPPVYYEGENYDIFVSLHNADGDLLETYKTDESGFYRFSDLPAGTYSLSAYLEEYQQAYKLYDIFTASVPKFYLKDGDILNKKIYLEYSHSEEGENRQIKFTRSKMI